MSVELIETIRKAEQEADEIVRSASAEAKNIVAEANKEAYQMIAGASDTAQRETDAQLQIAEAQGQTQRDKLLESAKNEAEALRLLTTPKLAKAADLIIERIVE